MADDRAATIALRFADDGSTPNHPHLPLLLHRGAISHGGGDRAAAVESTFRANGWTGLWRDGVYPFHHYHSVCHEALGIVRGWADLRFGGEDGETVRLEAGDVAVLPAGTGHKRVAASADFLVVGAYPPGQPYDMIRSGEASAEEHAAAVKRIRATPRPATDPVFGTDGGLAAAWSKVA